MNRALLKMAAAVPSVIHWFRLDLRIHDNLALRNAINEVNNYKISSIYGYKLV